MAVVVSAAVVVVAVVVVSLGMIFCLQIVHSLCLLKRRDGRTNGPTDGQTLLYRCEDASKNHALIYVDVLQVQIDFRKQIANLLWHY